MYGERLRVLRESRGFTQEEVAERIKEPVLQVWRYENEKVKSPKADFVAKLARLFNVSADYLMGLTDDPTPHDMLTVKLDARERAVVAALRRNEPIEAIKAIVGN